MNWGVDFDKDIMEDRPLKRALKASPWVKKIKRAPYLAGTRQQFEKELERLDESFKPWTDTIKQSEHLTAEDFGTRISEIGKP